MSAQPNFFPPRKHGLQRSRIWGANLSVANGFVGLGEERLKLDFVFPIDMDEENKQYAMYLVGMRTEDGASTTNVLVKFAASDNADAHRLSANRNLPRPGPTLPHV